MNKILLRSKFRGCMLGSLVGDCCGAPFEGDTFSTGAKLVLQKYFDTLEGQYFKAPVKKHTADSCLTKCVAQCLIAGPTRLDQGALAKSFTREFLSDPRRGYEENLIVIFNKLRANKFEEPLKAAREPANFASSSDNGAALRIAPVALAHFNDYNRMLEVARRSIEVTHSHREGVLGGLLQCVAVQQSLLAQPDQKLDVSSYATQLIERVSHLEANEEGMAEAGNPSPFKTQLEIMRDLLANRNPPSDEEVLDKLGHSNLALYSVPTAIYCFLRTTSETGEDSSPLRRCLQYAVSLGGDTSAVAGMAGALAGALHGHEALNPSLLRHCEASPLFEQLADGLFESGAHS